MRQSTADQSMLPPAPPSGSERGEIDLVALFHEVGRRKWRILVFTLATFVLATVAVNVIKPKYTGETRVFLENRDTEYTRIGRDGARGPEERFDADAVQSQVLIIQSRDIARQVIKTFDLGSKREFDSTIGGVDIHIRVMVMLGLITNPASLSPEERVMDSFSDKLKVYAVPKSRVLSIEFQSSDPALAAKVSMALAEEYIRHLEQAKKSSARSAGSWLSATIDPLRQRVADAEAKVEAFRSQNGLFQVGRESLTTISTQQLADLNTQLATARSQQSDLSSKSRLLLEAIRQGRIFEVSEVVNNDVVRRLLESRANLRAQIAQEEQTLLPQHPRIKELKAQLTGLEEQVRASAERTARTLENDARAAGARVAAVQAELDVQKRQNGSASGQEVQLRMLEREAKAEREQLETYLARYRDAASREGDNSVAADARIISKAMVPTNPSFPKKLPIILIATLSAFASSLFWTLMKSLLSEHVYVRRAVEAPAYPMMHPQMMGMYPASMYPANAQPINAQPTNAQPANVQPANAQPANVRPGYKHPGYAPARLPKGHLAAAVSDPAMETTQSAAKGTAAEPDAAPEPAVPSVVPPASIADARTRMSDAMRKAYARTTESLNEAARIASPLPVSAGATSKATAAPTVPDVEPYNPLNEIADAAHEALMSGRPVSILLLSVEGVAHAEGTVRALETILSRKGPAIATNLEPHLITRPGLTAAAKSLAGNIDFILFNGGKVSGLSRGLYEAVTIVVLVASDDLEDPRVDAAEDYLAGSDYFIVSAEPEKAPILAR